MEANCYIPARFNKQIGKFEIEMYANVAQNTYMSLDDDQTVADAIETLRKLIDEGTDGKDGITYEWLNGTTTPASALGKVGDWYINTNTCDIYKKTSATMWVLQCNIKGATGSNGEAGAKGDTGAAGKGISSTAITYQVGTSGTTVPTGTWQSTVQATSTGQFLWTRTITTYTDSTTSTAYSVSAHGATGAQGPAGSNATVTIVDNLTSTSTTSVLSANQGKILNDNKLPISGGTITGNLTLKGSGNYGNKLNFGDGDYVYLYEASDDNLDIKATRLNFYTGSTLAAYAQGGKLYNASGVEFGTSAASVKDNMTATADPKTTDYSGYAAGSMWFNHTNGTLWVCKSVSGTTATWTKMAAGYGN